MNVVCQTLFYFVCSVNLHSCLSFLQLLTEIMDAPQTGIVNSYSLKAGWGFIQPDKLSNTDIFFHRAQYACSVSHHRVKKEDAVRIAVGVEVTYRVICGIFNGRARAVDIEVIKDD